MKISRNNESGCWDLAGSLDIEAAEEIRTGLLACFAAPGEIVIDLQGVDRCDANGLQLLASGQRSAALQGRAFRIQLASDPVAALARALGFHIDGAVLTKGGK